MNYYKNLSASQSAAMKDFMAGKSLFLTGKAGTGKSFLTNRIRQYCADRHKNVLVCAPTGVAATNVGGSTLHRTFAIPVRLITPDEYLDVEREERNPDMPAVTKKRVRKWLQKKADVIKGANVIIIDEISMCRVDIFTYVANTLQRLNPTVQLLVVGDFYQLEPVAEKTPQNKEAYRQMYGELIYAFQSHLWRELNLKTIELQESMRQKDKAFTSALDNIRIGVPDFSLFQSRELDQSAVTLCLTNEMARNINEEQLLKLTNKQNPAKYIETGKTVMEEGFKVKESDYPCDDTLPICKGARIVMLTNAKEDEGHWVNGTMGTIIDYSVGNSNVDDFLMVKLESEDHPIKIEKHIWSINEYELITEKDGQQRIEVKTKASITQFPVRLAWAITVHKSQGQTYDKVNVIADGFFARGQMYVALSRCKTLEGTNIIGTLKEQELLFSVAVKNFMHGFYDGTELVTEKVDDPENEGQTIEALKVVSKNDWQEGYEVGYEDGTKATEAKYQERIANDKSVRKLSAYTQREREKAELPPEVRNPKGAGRKKLPINEQKESKAIRVPGDLADLFKEIGDLAKDDPSRIDDIRDKCSAIIESYK